MIHRAKRVVKEAIKAPLKNLREGHPGVCVLHEKRAGKNCSMSGDEISKEDQ